MFEKKSYILASVAAISGCVLMIIFSDVAVMSAKKGIDLWSSTILPSMLPFFISVNFMVGMGFISLLPYEVFPFVMSALSGYPMGAKVIGDMCRNGTVDIHEAKRIMSYCSTSGPVFMTGAVGIGMLGSQTAGYVIAVSHYAAAILNGFVYCRGSRKNICKHGASEIHINQCDLSEILTWSIFSSFKSMAVILSYVIIFMFVMDLVEVSGIINRINSDILKCLLKGFVEMTMGCSTLIGAECSLKTSCILSSIVISWGGLSILGQSMSMLSGTGISFGYLALTKLTHCIFAGIIALFLGNVML